MVRFYFFRVGEVGDRAGDFQDAVIRTSGEGELFHRVLEEVAERAVDRAVFADLRVGHAGVGGDFAAGKARVLAVARGLHPCADGFGGLARFFVTQFGNRERGRFNMDVDAVEKRAADARAIALDLRRRAAAFVFLVAEVAAGTRIHCRNQHEGTRQRDFAGAARNGDAAVFQGLSQYFERGALELGQFVEEEHAVVCERDFARTGNCTACRFTEDNLQNPPENDDQMTELCTNKTKAIKTLPQNLSMPRKFHSGKSFTRVKIPSPTRSRFSVAACVVPLQNLSTVHANVVL